MENKKYYTAAARGLAHGTIDRLIREMGSIEVLALIKKGMNKTETCPKFKTLIDPSEYGGTSSVCRQAFAANVSRSTERETLNIINAHNFNVKWDGRGGGDMMISHFRFAEWIVQNVGSEMLSAVLDVLAECPSWIRGHGISRFKMELVFHVLVLHEGEHVKTELINFLRDYDMQSLKVVANRDDEFRNTLNYDNKMIAYTEKKVCEALNLERRFAA